MHNVLMSPVKQRLLYIHQCIRLSVLYLYILYVPIKSNMQHEHVSGNRILQPLRVKIYICKCINRKYVKCVYIQM